ncbi:hypothetical protein ANANG_G00182540 [Anguilla anguilla]|uniref:Uncharacterized protein n=1 Tax=Anguilla anguilla TaxID=7936 RepID=A0A9D3MC11_ANGAN|nr:hypothetical protein ANANG_G00182540 [Anguilla anguilla]
MEPLPPVKDLLQQDELSEALQLIRARAPTQKLHVPCGVQLTVSRAKMGHSLYQPTSDFLNMGPALSIMKPSYNSLHDPHLYSYHYRRTTHNELRKGKYITKDNEVICSLKDYNIYEGYLRTLKLVADRTYDETQRDKMRKFIEFQEQGLLPGDVSLADVTEVLLEEGVVNRRQLLQAESVQQKNEQKGQEVENDSGQNGTDFYTELYMLTWNADDRSRLMMYEREFRHEQNKKKYLREIQKERDRKKQAALAQKCAIQHKELQEILKIAEGAAKEHSNRSKLQGDKFRLVPPGGNQYLLCRKRSVESRILRSDQLTRSEQKATSTEHKQCTLEHEHDDREWAALESNCEDCEWMEDSGENSELVDEVLREATEATEADHLGLRPRRRPFCLPPLRTGRRRDEMDQSCAIL